MKRLLLIFFFCCLWLINFGQIQPNLRVSTVEGVAPLTVFFDATATTYDNQAINPIHDLNYQWNFGDVYSGLWDFKPASRNTPTGAIATHVFDSSGTYIVELEISDFKGNSTIETIVIRVLSPERFYESSTVCFSRDNDFEGCPENAQKVTFKDGDLSVAQAFVGDKRQLLFRNGDTVFVNKPLDIKWTNHLTIGNYGNCENKNAKEICSNAPVFVNEKSNTIIRISSPNGTQWASNLIIKDLKFINENTDSNTTAIFCQDYTKRNLLYRLEIDGFTHGIHYDMENLWDKFHKQELFDEIVIANCKIKNGVGAGNLVTLSGKQSAILGSTLSNAIQGQSVLHLPWMQQATITHNEFLYPAEKHFCLKLESPFSDTVRQRSATRQVFITDNHFETYKGSEKIVEILPAHQKSKMLHDIILEGNYINTGTDNSVEHGLVVGGENITIRNNIINGSGGNQKRYNGITISDVSLSDKSKKIRAYNNTIYRQDWGKMVVGIRVDKDVEDVEITNNLVYTPLATTYKLTEAFTKDIVADNNAFPKKNPFINKKPTQPLDFQLDTIKLSFLQNQTSLCSHQDFYGQNRQPLKQCGIGAFEFTRFPITEVSFDGLSISSIHNYPNPQRNYLSIDLSKITGKYNIEIFNLQNNLVYSDYELTNRFYVWQVDTFDDGIYWVKVASKSATFLTKVFIQH
ncbi:MAG: T9SS type A sorting domain-containing protein [Saprospiraceae bacterium]